MFPWNQQKMEEKLVKKKNEKVMMTSNLEISEIESVMRHTTGMLILNLVFVIWIQLLKKWNDEMY